MPSGKSCGESPKKREHTAAQDGEVSKGDSVDDLGLGWELDLGIRGKSKTSKRAESVFRENPEIKQILYYLRLISGHGQSSSTICTGVLSF
jgi:hypothetical protein